MVAPHNTTSGHPTEWLSEILGAVGVVPSLVIEEGADDGRVSLEGFPNAARMTPESNWRAALGAGSEVILVNCIIESHRQHALRASKARSRQAAEALSHHWVSSGRDAPAQLLRSIVESCSAGQTVVALIPPQVLKGTNAGPLRAWLAREHHLDWLVFLSGFGHRMSAHPTSEPAILVLRPKAGPSELLRLVELTGADSGGWRSEIVAMGNRGGGEVGNGVVLRTPDLGAEAWTYKRFTRGYRKLVDDARGLGSLVKLGELFIDLTRGMHQALAMQHEIAFDLFTEVEGGVPCFSGRSISGARLDAPQLWIQAKDVPKGMRLREGDCLLRSFIARAPGRSSTRAALVRGPDLPGTFDHTLIRLRPRPGTPASALELVVSFLNSPHFAQMLDARGANSQISIARLEELEVPVPSGSVIEALDRLAASEAKYKAWAAQCGDARSSIHLATSYSAAVQRLLAQEQIDFERVQAAEDSQTLDFRIRNDYPHPIALRRELIRQLKHGQERLDKTLLCAEHAMNLLALAAMVQLAGGDDLSERPQAASIKGFVRDGKLMMDWGKAEAIVREGLAHTAKTKDPLSLPFPALVRLTDSADDSFLEAEQRLRNVRNNTKHLEEIPPLDLESISRQASEDLEALLEALQVLIVTPLAVVDDYQMDPTTRDRYATFRILRGISQAYPVEQRQIDREIPRGAVGFLDHAGCFRSLSPWLVMKTCPKCGREEIFVFSKYDGETAKYVSMETGHASSDDRAAAAFGGLLRPESVALP